MSWSSPATYAFSRSARASFSLNLRHTIAQPRECFQKTVGSSPDFLPGNACPMQQVKRIDSTRRNPRITTAAAIDLGGCARPKSGELRSEERRVGKEWR